MTARIIALKQAARRALRAHDAIADRYDCGIALAAQFNPDIDKHAREFNAAMDELAKLDPNAPTTRLQTSKDKA